MYIVGRRIINTNLEHKHHARVDVFVLRQRPHPREVYVEMRLDSGRVKLTADGGQEHAQALDFVFIGIFHIAKKFLDAFVHETLCQHLQLEELAEEPDEAQFATFCLACGGGGGHLLSGPTSLQVLLTAIEQILYKQITARQWLALGILHVVVLDFGANLHQHLAT
jgi:hypothetical protein